MDSRHARATAQPHGPNTVLAEISLLRVSGAVVDEFFFVLSYPPIELVYQAIDRCIHVFFDCISVNRTAIHFDCSFCFVPQLLDSEDTVDVRYQIKVTCDLVNLGLDITSEGSGYLDVMA